LLPYLVAVGVGNNPDPVAPVRGTNVGSRYAVPFCIVPDLGQVSENSAKPSALVSRKQRWDVLHDRVARCHLANNSGEVGPESRAFGVDSGLSPSDGEVLAGESSANNVN